ncbi:MAG: deaminase [Bacteroidetes bacterium]|nr:deaminase [Bacteroidota bacterium]
MDKYITNKRPLTTLFMLMSLDGKISTGKSENLDVDKDFPEIRGIAEGLYQYYELEQNTDLHSLNTGRVQAKIGANKKKDAIKTPVNFIIIDNKPHLTENGVQYLMNKSKKLFLITTNKLHPAFHISMPENLEIIYYENTIDFKDLFYKFKSVYDIEAITIQSGGTLNSVLLRQGLIDYVSIVIAPCLIGGKDTPTIIDGESFSMETEIKEIKTLELKTCKTLNNSYIHLKYKVNNTI